MRIHSHDTTRKWKPSRCQGNVQTSKTLYVLLVIYCLGDLRQPRLVLWLWEFMNRCCILLPVGCCSCSSAFFGVCIFVIVQGLKSRQVYTLYRISAEQRGDRSKCKFKSATRRTRRMLLPLTWQFLIEFQVLLFSPGTNITTTSNTWNTTTSYLNYYHQHNFLEQK